MARIFTALILIPIVAWAVLAAPQWAFLMVAGLVGLGAYREFDGIAAAQGIARGGVTGMVAGLVLLLAPEPGWPFVIAIALVFMLLMLRQDDLAKTLPGAAAALLGVVYIFGAWRSAALLREINPHWLMLAFMVSWVGDTAALYTGRAFGKSKMAPRISPGKTWAGAIGSVAAATIGGAIYGVFLMPQVNLGFVALVAAVANVAGQAGDLCESAFKRGAGLKDSGSMLPGHGGWLDRVDSSLFSVPTVYLLVLSARLLVGGR